MGEMLKTTKRIDLSLPGWTQYSMLVDRVLWLHYVSFQLSSDQIDLDPPSPVWTTIATNSPRKSSQADLMMIMLVILARVVYVLADHIAGVNVD